MTLSVLEGHFLLQAFSSEKFRICGTSHGPSASAEFLVLVLCGHEEQAELFCDAPCLLVEGTVQITATVTVILLACSCCHIVSRIKFLHNRPAWREVSGHGSII